MDHERVEETAAGQFVQCRASGEVGCQQFGDRRHLRILETEPWLCQRVALDCPAKPPRQRILVKMNIEVDDALETGRMSFDRYVRRNVAEGKRTVMAVLFRRSGLSDGEGAGSMQLEKRKQPMLG